MSGEDAQDQRKISANWREYLREAKESIHVYGWVLRELVSKDAKRWTIYVLVGLAGMILIGALRPLLLAKAIADLQARNPMMLIAFLAAACATNFKSELLHWLHAHWREYVLGDNQGMLDKRTTELFFEKSLGQHLRDSGSLSAANVEKGRNRATEVEHMMLFDGFSAFFDLLVPWTLLWFVSPMAGAALFLLLVLYVGWMLYLNRKTVEACTPIDAEFRKLNRRRVELWDNIERVKSNGKEQEEIRNLTAWFGRALAPDRKFWLWFIRMITVRGMINHLFTSAIIAWAGWQAWQGKMEPLNLLPISMWTWQVAGNLWRFGQIEHRLNWNMPSVRSMRDALTMKPEIVDRPGAVQLAPAKPMRVEFRNVSFAYPQSETETSARRKLAVLRDASFTIEPGEKVALIGPSGAGKTTIMRLLMRNYDPTGGSILIDGTDVRDIGLSSWTRLLGYIPQQAQILDGDLRSNILYGLTEAEQALVKDEDLVQLMKRTRIDFASLETVVGRRGMKLSGGQAQRVMIAAAAMRRPPFMVIDEATSSLDSTTEKEVQQGLEEILKDRSTSALIIAHRLSTVERICSKFIVLRSAEAVEPGESQIEAIADSFFVLALMSPTFRRLAGDQGISPRLLQAAK